MKKLLIITTNSSGNDKIPDTGVYLEEFAVPYLVFQKSDIEVTVASPEGGLSPVDENSMSCSNPEEWDECIKILRETKKLSDIDLEEFDGVYFPRDLPRAGCFCKHKYRCRKTCYKFHKRRRRHNEA